MPVGELAAPHAFAQQLDLGLHDPELVADEKIERLGPLRLHGGPAVEPLCALIPKEQALVEVADDDGVGGEV